MKFIRRFFIAGLFAFSLFPFTSNIAQTSVDVGADIVSRYIWRGLDFGYSPAVQPSLKFISGNFKFNIWGSYQTTRSASVPAADELDLLFSYSVKLGGSGTLNFLLTDYYFPTAGFRLFNFNSDKDAGGGAHTFEGGIAYSGPESFPITFSGYVNFYSGTDSDNSSYFEISYSQKVDNIGLNLFLGASPGGKGKFYGTEKFNVINLGLTASKSIKITEDFQLPIFVSYIINPNSEIAYFVFGVSL